MTVPQTQTTAIFSSSISADTDVDLSTDLPELMDTRGDNDPIVDAILLSPATPTTTDLTSQGQQDGSLSSGEIEVIDDHTVQLGDAISDGDILLLTYEAVNQGQRTT